MESLEIRSNSSEMTKMVADRECVAAQSW